VRVESTQILTWQIDSFFEGNSLGQERGNKILQENTCHCNREDMALVVSDNSSFKSSTLPDELCLDYVWKTY